MEDYCRIDDDPATTNLCSNGDGNVLSYLPINNNGKINQFDDERDMEIFGSEMFDLIKSQIVTHPRFSNLISAYLECRKLGAPAEVASLLDEIGREVRTIDGGCCSTEIGTNPELDEFMESYCLFLSRYKNELSKPLDEATTFLREVERQFSELFIDKSPTSKRKKFVVTCNSDDEETACDSVEEQSCSVEVEARLSKKSSTSVFYGDPALKEMLLQRYSGYLSSLRTQFLKKKRKGKLPKDSSRVLLEWWNTHYRWPYPTEEEKMKLCEITGLNHKQITNWFINQRKRHWKPSEDQRIALVNCLSDTGAPLMFNTENG